MKNIIKLLMLSLLFISCNDYLTHDVDQQLTFEKTFARREQTERFLAAIYSYVPDDSEMFENMVGNSDEAYYMYEGAYGKYLNHNSGNWNPTSGDYHNWDAMYKGINQATVFIENVDSNTEITDDLKRQMKAEARFLRAYFYFQLVRQYGPVYIWGDKMPELNVIATEVDRHSLDVCIDFISTELKRAAIDLPLTISDRNWLGRATKGAALGLNSRILLYRARPLFNGASIYKGIKNKDGDFLFPQNSSPEKWDLAAAAAKELIDLNVYKLRETSKSGTTMYKAIQSYSEVLFEPWNEEIIFARNVPSAQFLENRVSPKGIVGASIASFSPSLRLVDTYPMHSSGRYPITGYLSNGEPIIDQASGYTEIGFTMNYNNPADLVESHKFKAHNSTVGRDARFYASIFFNGMYWINNFRPRTPIYFQKGGNARYTEPEYNKTGYLFRRLVNPNIDTEIGASGKYSWPIIRLAEIYLNYAEACNEMTNRNESEALLYVNKVRARSNLNKIEEAYPEIYGNKELLRTIISKERMIELAFENHRYWDIRHWMIAPEVVNEERYGRNQDADTYEDSWKRTKHYMRPIVFRLEHYLFPMQQKQLNQMKNLTQNYGW